MNPEIKALWLKALRSNTYSQGHSMLRNNLNQFCCLGVLCDIYEPVTWVCEDSEWAAHMQDEDLIFDESGELPNPMATALDISARVEGELISMNDNERKTFAEIADWIEENL